MSASTNAQMAIDANFDMNGLDAQYFSVWPGTGVPCRVIPAQPDVEFGMDVGRIQVMKSQFMLRASDGITPVKGGFLMLGVIRYRVEETPQPDDLRLLWRLNCVKA